MSVTWRFHCLGAYTVYFISIQDGATALTIASESGFTPIVEVLCEAGANVDHINAVSSIPHIIIIIIVLLVLLACR